MKILITLLHTLLFAFPIFAAPVDVASFALVGDGTQANPWKNWETRINPAEGTEYRFRKGWFAYDESINWLKPGVAIIGEAGANLQHYGSGDAFIMDAGEQVGELWIQNVRVENLTIWGNSQTRHGFFLRGVRNGVFRNLSVKNVAEAGIWTEGCVTNILENFRVTNHEPTKSFGWTVRPRYGIVTAGRGGDWSTTWTIINPVIENVAAIGIWFKADSYGNTVVNGTSEGNLGKGMVIEGSFNSFLNIDLEANGGRIDAEIKGQNNSLINITSDSSVKLLAGQRHRIDGGKLRDLYIHPYVDQAVITSVTLSGALSDNSLSTISFGNSSSAGFLKGAKIGIVLPTLQYLYTPNGILNTNARLGDFFIVNAYSDLILANPINAVEGQKITWRFTTLGDYTISYGNKFKGKNGIYPQMPQTAGWWYLTARYNAQQNCWDIVDYSY